MQICNTNLTTPVACHFEPAGRMVILSPQVEWTCHSGSDALSSSSTSTSSEGLPTGTMAPQNSSIARALRVERRSSSSRGVMWTVLPLMRWTIRFRFDSFVALMNCKRTFRQPGVGFKEIVNDYDFQTCPNLPTTKIHQKPVFINLRS